MDEKQLKVWLDGYLAVAAALNEVCLLAQNSEQEAVLYANAIDGIVCHLQAHHDMIVDGITN